MLINKLQTILFNPTTMERLTGRSKITPDYTALQVESSSTPKRLPDRHNRCWNGKYWCVRDVCGIFCALLTWALIFYAEFVVINVILLPYAHASFYSIINIVLYMIVTILAVSSHVRTMLSDPVSS